MLEPADILFTINDPVTEALIADYAERIGVDPEQAILIAVREALRRDQAAGEHEGPDVASS